MNLVSGADLQDTWVDQFTPGGQRVTHCTCSRTARHLATFTRRPGSSLYTLTTTSPPVTASGQVAASLPPLPLRPAPTCVRCVEGRQRAALHSSTFPPTEAPLQTLHMDVWGPAHVCGQGYERYFLLVVDDYSRYTSVFPLRSKGEVTEVLIDWIRGARRQLSERFGSDLPVLRLHSDRGGEFSSDLLRAFCRAEGIHQTFTLLASQHQNGIAERRIGMVMDVARTSMIHAAAPHFLWPFALLSAILEQTSCLPVPFPASSLAYPLMHLGGSSTTPHRVMFCPLRTSRLTSRCLTTVSFPTALPLSLPPPLILAPGTPPVDPRPPQGPAPSGVSQVDPAEPVEVAVDSGAARGAEPSGAGTGGAEPGDSVSEGAEPGGAEPERVEPGGAEPGGAESGDAEPRGTASWGAEPERAESGGPPGVLSRREPLSPQQLRKWYARRCRGAAGAGGALGTAGGASGAGAAGGGARGPGAVGGPAGVGAAGGAGAASPAGARTGGTGAAGTGGAAGAGAAGAGVDATGGASRAGAAGGTRAGGAARRRAAAAVLCSAPSASSWSTAFSWSYSSFTESTAYLVTVAVTASLSTTCVSLCRHLMRPFFLTVRTRSLTLFVLLVLLSRALFESTPASALVAELVDFAAACRIDYATSLVAESASASVCPPSVGGECALGTDVLEDRQEEFECFAAAVPPLVSMLLAPEGDPDAPDIPTSRSYAEAIEGPYSSQWQAAMDAEMASWKSTGTYVDEVPPPGANIVIGMWIFRGVDFFKTFSPTPKMTTLRVLLYVAAHLDYELHSLDFSTAFLQGTLHEEIWLRRPPGFTGSFLAGTQWNLRRPVYGLRQAPREWHNTLRTTLPALGFAPSTADPSQFLRTDTTLPLFYVLVYVDDLVFATADTEALAHMKSELQKRHSCTDLGPSALRLHVLLATVHSSAYRSLALCSTLDESVEPSGPYPELVGCLMYLMTCTRPDLAYPLSLLARYVAPGRHRKRLSQGYTFNLGSGSVSWLSTRSSSVLSSSCEAEIYAGAMAAQELRWLTYLLIDLGEAPRSPPVLYVDNKAMLALCQEHRLEHRMKHIALRYFLARELQQCGQLCLAYVASQANTADVFTKALQPCDHQHFCTVLGLVPTVPHLFTS
ncbi:unnamed protein product [Closterium sp. NIES-54]